AYVNDVLAEILGRRDRFSNATPADQALASELDRAMLEVDVEYVVQRISVDDSGGMVLLNPIAWTGQN
ncbi:MAG: hypothetical protein AAFY03_03070, partial [Pseudomonadota bacterium]